MGENISALILAAGMSRRMGRPKQLLEIAKESMLSFVIKQVVKHPFQEIIIVLGHEAKHIKEEIPLFDERCQYVYNPNFADGQHTSFQIGMKSLKHEHGMVFLGDMPFIQFESIAKIYERGQKRTKITKHPFILRPTFDGKPGHPVFFGFYRKINLQHISRDQGAKGLMKQIQNYEEIPMRDDGVTFDIDTEEAYAQARQRLKL